ncbi:MAG: ATP-binding protein [Oscillospiraceae bacterium]|nr:ATP-binding protein [Oscillospiraceae bacterium]
MTSFLRNPCPCGFFGHPTRECTCPTGAAARYLAKVSGPVLDRLDIHIEVPPVDFQKLSDREKSECSADSGKSKANKNAPYKKLWVLCFASGNPGEGFPSQNSPPDCFGSPPALFCCQGNTAKLGCADGEVRFFVGLHRKTDDLLTQVKGFMCKLTE